MSRATMIYGRIIFYASGLVAGWLIGEILFQGAPLLLNLALIAMLALTAMLTGSSLEPLPPKRQIMRSLDVRALTIAAQGYSIQDPLQIISERLPDGVDAYYRREGAIHQIVLDDRLTPQEMSKAIYHELYHAHEVEQDFNGDGEAFHMTAYMDSLFAALDGDTTLREERATTLELLDYELRLVKQVYA